MDNLGGQSFFLLLLCFCFCFCFGSRLLSLGFVGARGRLRSWVVLFQVYLLCLSCLINLAMLPRGAKVSIHKGLGRDTPSGTACTLKLLCPEH